MKRIKSIADINYRLVPKNKGYQVGNVYGCYDDVCQAKAFLIEIGGEFFVLDSGLKEYWGDVFIGHLEFTIRILLSEGMEVYEFETSKELFKWLRK